MNQLGIKGRTWKWNKAFLTSRSANCSFDNYKGPSFESKIGLPQGSVLAPTLFNLYISDLLQDINGDHTKFASMAPYGSPENQKL